MHFNQAKPSNNQNTNEYRSETTITLAGSGVPRHSQKCERSRLEAIDPAQKRNVQLRKFCICAYMILFFRSAQ